MSDSTPLNEHHVKVDGSAKKLDSILGSTAYAPSTYSASLQSTYSASSSGKTQGLSEYSDSSVCRSSV
jgi:hypothetical protein